MTDIASLSRLAFSGAPRRPPIRSRASPLADGAGPSIWQRFAHTSRPHDERRHRRHRLRPLRALPRRRAADARARPPGVPLQHQLEPRPSRGHGPRERGAGSDFYERLVDALLEAGITPNATLFHWDLPAALDDRGGWLNRDVADWFGDYARVVFARARRPRPDVGHAQRAVGRHRRRLPARRARAGPSQPVRGADRQPQPAARARRRRAGVPRRGAHRPDRARREPRAEGSRHRQRRGRRGRARAATRT